MHLLRAVVPTLHKYSCSSFKNDCENNGRKLWGTMGRKFGKFGVEKLEIQAFLGKMCLALGAAQAIVLGIVPQGALMTTISPEHLAIACYISRHSCVMNSQMDCFTIW